ncbi:glycosyltransferase [Lacticaseibacillus brantae]|nr:glycosyltransferase [Lacticaseibacillus brantae]
MIFYFLTQMIDFNVSGIEHAEIKRLHLFHRFDQAAKIATRNYNRYLTLNLHRHGLHQADSMNMFDYFQGTLDYHAKRATQADVTIAGTTVVHDNTRFDYLKAGQKVASVFVFTDPKHYVENQIEEIQYYGATGQIWRIDYYDVRGFKSSTDYRDQEGKLSRQVMYDLNGQVKIESFWRQQGDNDVAAIYQLDYQNKLWFFRDLDEMLGFFYDELVRTSDHQAGFIGDRLYITDPGMHQMQEWAPRYGYWHNVHTYDPDAVWTGKLNDVLVDQMTHADMWRALITPTSRQSHDVQSRMTGGLRVKTIPGPIVPDEQLAAARVPFSARTPYKIIDIARIHEQKRLDHLLAAFIQVHAQFPAATLEIHGYVNEQKIKDDLLQQARDGGVADAVALIDYTPDLGAVYDSAQIFAMSSRYEGFPLSLVEAASHGVPLISYDVNYGPEEIIDDGKNGYLVEKGNIDALAAAMIKALSDQAKLAEMSTASYEIAKRFSEPNVWQLWHDLVVKDAEAHL